MFKTADDIRREKATAGVFVQPVIVRVDRVRLTSNGPVVFLNKGESLIEFGEPRYYPNGCPILSDNEPRGA